MKPQRRQTNLRGCCARRSTRLEQEQQPSRTNRETVRAKSTSRTANGRHQTLLPVGAYKPALISALARKTNTNKPTVCRKSARKPQKPTLNCYAANFSLDLIHQLKNSNIKTTLDNLNLKIAQKILNINKIILGQPVMTPQILTQKPLPEKEDSDLVPFYKPIPCSQWVFETPDKQRMRKMEELNFNFEEPLLEPAVIQECKRIKTVFALGEKLWGLDHTQFEAGDTVPINVHYLNPVCVVPVDGIQGGEPDAEKPFEFNQFLEKDEETIDFDKGKEDVEQVDEFKMSLGGARKRSFKPSPQPKFTDNAVNLNWYERHMKMLATCRPVKSASKLSRRKFLQRKSLSFQEETPPSSNLHFKTRFRSFDTADSIDEADFTLLESEFYEDTPKTSSSSPFAFNKTQSLFEIPATQFYNSKDFKN